MFGQSGEASPKKGKGILSYTENIDVKAEKNTASDDKPLSLDAEGKPVKNHHAGYERLRSVPTQPDQVGQITDGGEMISKGLAPIRFAGKLYYSSVFEENYLPTKNGEMTQRPVMRIYENEPGRSQRSLCQPPVGHPQRFQHNVDARRQPHVLYPLHRRRPIFPRTLYHLVPQPSIQWEMGHCCQIARPYQYGQMHEYTTHHWVRLAIEKIHPLFCIRPPGRKGGQGHLVQRDKRAIILLANRIHCP